MARRAVRWSCAEEDIAVGVIDEDGQADARVVSALGKSATSRVETGAIAPQVGCKQVVEVGRAQGC